MNNLRGWAAASKTLAILGLGALFLSFLALTDIFHGEENAKLEWGILQLAFFVILFLIVATFILTGLVFKHFRGNDAEKVWAAISATLGIAGLVFLSLATLALMGIYHGEKDANPEWALLRLAFLVIFVLIIAIFISTGLMAKYFRDRGAEKDRPSPGQPGRLE
jgi:heme/copper-type cytochrome/quinol oxidase subunit 2